MSFRLTVLAALLSAVFACKTAPRGAEEGDACAKSVDCAAPLICLEGVCAHDPARSCEPDETRCNGSAQERCVDDEQLGPRWVSDKDCPAGCLAGTCQEPTCEPNLFACEPAVAEGASSVISRCNPNGTSWTTYQLCATGCAVSEDATTATCNDPICEPFQTRCSQRGAAHLETCNGSGTGWIESGCPAGDGGESVCVSGRCADVVCQVTRDEDGLVVDRQERCNGYVAEQCGDTGTRFEARESCVAGCNEVDGRAVCADVVCAPSSTRCVDVESVETCNASGTGWSSRSCSTTAGPGRCADGVCLPKVCSVTRVDGEISERDLRCEGVARQACNDSETDWTTVELCAFGCALEGDPAQPTCSSPVCAPGERACQDDWLVECSGDRRGFDYVASCAAGCLSDPEATPATAVCAATMCTPLDSRCGFEPGEGSHFVEVCVADGTGYSPVGTCAQGCFEGNCLSVQTGCEATALRCVGQEVQRCELLANNATEWRFLERCLGDCSSGACLPGGACGCADGESTTACGGTARRPLSLTALVPDGSVVSCDGESRVALTTSVITDAAGVPVPDGTLVTFSVETLTMEPDTDRPGADYSTFVPASADPHVCRQACAADERCVAWTYRAPVDAADEPGCALKNAASAAQSAVGYVSGARVGGSAGLLASIDADPSTAGLQRPTLDGRAIVLVRAPDGCEADETVRVVGSLGGHCSGSGQVDFAPPSADPSSREAWFAEDFSSRALFDRMATTAIWDTSVGLRALTPFEFGTGKDLALEVLPAHTFELDTEGYATVHDVLSVGEREVSVMGRPPALAKDDEVLLVNVYGPASVRGRYEFKTVADVVGQRVLFTEPVAGVYSSQTAGNLDLSGQRVVLQRVPHFTSVVVETDGVLTMSPMTHEGGVPTGGSGILAFRASEGVYLQGSLGMNGRGMAAGTTNPGRASGTASLDRLVVGESTGGTGGGVVYVHAPRITFLEGIRPAAPDQIIDARPQGAGHGGTIWVAAGDLRLGTACLPGMPGPCRVTGGDQSQVRLDFGTCDLAPDRIARPAPYLGLAGPYVARSLTAFRHPEPTGADPDINIRTAELVALVAGDGASEVIVPGSLPGGLPQVEPELTVLLSADGGQTFTTAESGTTLFFATGEDRARPGRQFQWRATLTPARQRLPVVRALSFRLSLN